MDYQRFDVVFRSAYPNDTFPDQARHEPERTMSIYAIGVRYPIRIPVISDCSPLETFGTTKDTGFPPMSLARNTDPPGPHRIRYERCRSIEWVNLKPAGFDRTPQFRKSSQPFPEFINHKLCRPAIKVLEIIPKQVDVFCT
ncbi:hypothetical protein [Streptomyces sp. NPDC001601]|uniref:hypothetical protein n=1 Tax=Streptomyces sp. NPDC001601 TaxID=3364592 RepID=UPI00368E0991